MLRILTTLFLTILTGCQANLGFTCVDEQIDTKTIKTQGLTASLTIDGLKVGPKVPPGP